MEIGQTMKVKYMGGNDEESIFATPMLTDVIKIPTDKIIGRSMLEENKELQLKRQTFGDYVVSM